MANMFSKKTRTLTQRANDAQSLAVMALSAFAATADTLESAADSLEMVSHEAHEVVKAHGKVRDDADQGAWERRRQADNIRKVFATS